MELEISTEPQETIIEPVLRNQYLTKLKRLLPTFFKDFDPKDLDSVLLGQQIQKFRQTAEEANVENIADRLEISDPEYYSS